MNFGGRFNARHARKADDVVGFQTGQCCRGHFRNGGGARVLHHADATWRAGRTASLSLRSSRRDRTRSIPRSLPQGPRRLDVEAPRPLSGWAVEALGEGQQPGSACDRRRDGRRPKLGAPPSGPRYRSVGLRFVVFSIITCIALLSTL
jgi:hypothetical protein